MACHPPITDPKPLSLNAVPMRTNDPHTVFNRLSPRHGTVSEAVLCAVPSTRVPFKTTARGDRRTPPSTGGACRDSDFAAGFTLLEMIVVILLLTILLGFAIPAFQEKGVTGSRENVARELLFAVKKLKIAALSRQRIHKLHLNLDESRIWVTREEKATGEEMPAPQSEWTLPEDARIAHVRFPDNREIGSGTVVMAFYPRGYSDRAIIRLSGDSHTYIDVIIEAFLPFARIASEENPIEF